MPNLHESWVSYRVKVLPLAAPTVEVQECRRAFYAGAQACLGLFFRDAVARNVEPAYADLAVIAALDGELKRFLADVQAGRA